MLNKKIDDQIVRWAKELVDLTRRNRLLYFRHTRSASLEFEQDAEAVIRGLTSAGERAGWGFYLPPPPPPLGEDGEAESFEPVPPDVDQLVAASHLNKKGPEIERGIVSLSRKSVAEYLDSGLWVLFLGIGAVNWHDGDQQVQSPILLQPVQLQRKSGGAGWRLIDYPDSEPVINPALAVKFYEDFEIVLPTLDGLGSKDSYREIKSEVEKSIQSQSTWSVDNRVVLSTFTFQKEVIYNDLLQNKEQIAEHNLVQLLVEGPTSEALSDTYFDPIDLSDLDERHPPEDLNLILDSDGSQRQCILAALQGESFVMDGPPGTGKSQTIANMIASLISEGKSVLFVSEKAAALEVVYNRLEHSGLKHFLMDLHSNKLTRKAVAHELNRALQEQPKAKYKWTAQKKVELQKNRRDLNSYAIAINEVRRPLELSVHDAIGQISEAEEITKTPPFEGSVIEQTPEFLNELKTEAEQLSRAWGPVVREGEFLWRDLKDIKHSASRESHLRNLLDTLNNASEDLRDSHRLVQEDLELSQKSSPENVPEIIELLEIISKRVQRPAPEWLTTQNFTDVNNEVKTLCRTIVERDTAREKLSELVVEPDQLDTGAADRVTDLASRAAVLLNLRDSNQEAIKDHSNGENQCRSCQRLLNPNAKFCGGCGAASEYKVPTESAVAEPGKLLDLNSEELAQLGEQFGVVAEAIIRAEQAADELGEAFLVRPPITLTKASRLVDLALLKEEINLPDKTWFGPGAAERVKIAIAELGTVVIKYQEAEKKARQFFTEEVLALDLESLEARFKNVHQGLKKFGSSYKEDKRILGSAVIGGVAGPESIDALKHAIQWAKIKKELRSEEKVHSSTLGVYYKDHETSDFEAAGNALKVLEAINELRSVDLDHQAVIAQLAHGNSGSDLRGAIALVRQARHSIETSPAQKWLHVAGEEWVSLSITQVSKWLGQLSGIFGELGDEQAQICTSIINGRDLTLAATLEILERQNALLQQNATIETLKAKHQTALNAIGASETPETITQTLDWSDKLRTHFRGPLQKQTAELATTSTLTAANIEPQYGNYNEALKTFLHEFNEERQSIFAEAFKSDFQQALQLIGDLRNSITEIEEWSTFKTTKDLLSGMGAAMIVETCIADRVVADNISKIIQREFLKKWVEETIESDARLKTGRAVDRDALTQKFRELDKELIEETAHRIINACSDNRPTSALGEAGLIRQQGQLKSRHLSVAKQIAQAGATVKRLKPCVMMSPLSASQFLPADIKFDVVIFDEASQVREADAIGCIYRGRQLIVAGDQKQLPPTSFWERTTEEEEEVDDEAPDYVFESVLDRCKAQGLRTLGLNWHYRSQHENLITFSNRSFYGGRLQTFPGATFEAPDLGVELFKVDGTYLRGGLRNNPVEAAEVVNRVVFHRRNHPELSIGCVTFSAAQQVAVEAEIERRSREVPELEELHSESRLDGFFVKNLESVQGDERDIIIFSIGYGPDEDNKLTMNFGPMNRLGGERRLNVAITRARRKVEVVSSIVAGDIRSENESVKHFQRYLDFADRGVSALALDFEESQGDAESVFEEQVIAEIRHLGYEAVPQVGVAGYRLDIGVRSPYRTGSFILGVECDGATYHSSYVARDRDRLRQEVLEGLGWKLHRIWSTAWFRDRNNEILKLKQAIEQDTLRSGAAPQKPIARSEPVELEIEEIDFEAVPDWLISYKTPKAKAPSQRMKQWGSPEARPIITEQLIALIKEHGPIHFDVCFDALKDSWNSGMKHPSHRDAIREAAETLSRQKKIIIEKDFYRSHSFFDVESPQVRGMRTGKEDVRDVDHVPPQELHDALKRLVEEAIGKVSADEALLKRWQSLFGWTRSTPPIRNMFEKQIDQLRKEGIEIDTRG